MAIRIPVLIVTGPVGVGKTTVAAATSDVLSGADIAHAMVDMDALRWCSPRPAADPYNVALGLRNLAAVWENDRDAGATCLVAADVIESRADLAGYRVAVPDAEIVVARLRAPLATIERRLAGRDTGAALGWHRRRAAELVAQMERDRVEDLLVETDGKAPFDIAREILTRAGWPDAPH